MDLRLNLMVRRGGTTTVRAAERSPRRSSSLERSSAAAWSPSLCVSSEEEEGRSPEATSMCWGDAQAKDDGSTRFCMGAAWQDTIGRKTNFNQILEYIKEIRHRLQIPFLSVYLELTIAVFKDRVINKSPRY